MNNVQKTWYLVVVLFAWTLCGQAMQLHLDGTRISLTVEGAPVKDVLMQFAQSGVRVKMDPSINTTVTAHVEDEDLEVVLEELLVPYGYALIWDVLDAPLGAMPRLAEMQVFRRGQESQMVPLYDPNANLLVTRGPNPGDPAYVSDEILLAVKKGTSLSEFKQLLGQLGGTVIECAKELGVYRIRFMPGANVPALVAQLKGKDMVHTVEPNYVIEVPPSETSENAGSAVTTTVHQPADGSPALAILDSGLGGFDALNPVVVGRLDAVSPDRELADPLGHGTQMALVGAGVIDPGSQTTAENDGLPLVAIRAFDDNGAASNFGIMRSIEYALEQGARVVNMSWGSEVDSDFLGTAMAYAQSKDLILVASAGNKPTGQPLYPAAYPGVIAVAATAGDERWEQSNYGDFISLAAPGTASFPVGYNGPPGSYAGTSISSAYVARALTLYLAAHPDASRKDVISALQQSLRDAGDEGQDPYYGHGVLDNAALGRLLGP